MDLKVELKTIDCNPDKSGWYDTDEGLLYWMMEERCWSCRDDRLSEEYPDKWYREATLMDISDYLTSYKVAD